MFKVFRSYAHGQRGYCNQISENMCITLDLSKKKKDVLNGMVDYVMKDFLNSIDTAKKEFNGLKTPKKITDITHSFLKKAHIPLDDSDSLEESNIVILNKIEYHTEEHDLRYNHNNFTVMFKQNNEICFGNIQKIVKLNSDIYCLIKKFNSSKINLEFNYTNNDLKAALNNFNNFYIRLHEDSHQILVHSRNIIKKCILMQLDNFYIASPCNNLFEHD